MTTKTTKPTPEQRKIINAIKWCKQRATAHDKARAKALKDDQHNIYALCLGSECAFEVCAKYLNSKLPKELRVKL